MSSAGSVYAIVGADSHLAEEALESLLQAAVGKDRADAVQVLRGEETSWARVVEAARTGSLFATRRAVVVRGADGLKGEGEELFPYLQDPSPDTALVVMAVKPDRRRVVWKRLLDRAKLVPAEPLRGRALRAYVADQLKKRRLAVGEDGLQELIDRVGQDLRRLMGEVDKLEAFAAGGSGRLGAAEVAAVLGRGLARPLYLLSDAIAARQAGRSLELIEQALEEGEEPLRILGTVHRSLRQVRAARALQQARAPRDEMLARLDMQRHAFKLPDVLESARAWTDGELVDAMTVLSEADRRLKTGGNPPRLVLAAAVAAATRKRPEASRARPAR